MTEKLHNPSALLPLGIPIRLADGSDPTSLDSVRSWEVGQPTTKVPFTADEMMEEEHHHYYGRPWILGRYYFDCLLEFGLKTDHVVLDLGCGAGRVGIHTIPYLQSGNYCGIDYHLRSLVAFAQYESFLYNLSPRKPLLLWDHEFQVGAFGREFDVVLDFYVTHHLDNKLVETAYRNVSLVTRPGARVFFAHEPTLGFYKMRELGFGLLETREFSYPYLESSQKPMQKKDLWHVLVRL